VTALSATDMAISTRPERKGTKSAAARIRQLVWPLLRAPRRRPLSSDRRASTRAAWPKTRRSERLRSGRARRA
jgi:hypothetical protein